VSQEIDTEVWKILEKVRLTRIEKGFSILDLATRAEISHSYVFYLESKKKVPTLTVLNRIAKALGVPMKFFFE
jgi:transcriptional regulator with XRE-family HTH domain